VVVITGRRAHEVVPLLGIDPHPEIWGAHGLQRLRPDGSCELPNPDEIATQALSEADAWLDRAGLHHLAEHKPGGLAVHWRGLRAEEQSEIRRIVSLSWLPVAHRAGMVFQEFDGGVEIRMPDRNKGDAVRSILSELSPEAPVAYLGDDETDEDAFKALVDRGLRVLVRSEYRETAANIWLKPVAELLAFLCDWMEACRIAERPPRMMAYTHDRTASRGGLT
jgi:trehalose 6-phosphate phosphatase